MHYFIDYRTVYSRTLSGLFGREKITSTDVKIFRLYRLINYVLLLFNTGYIYCHSFISINIKRSFVIDAQVKRKSRMSKAQNVACIKRLSNN